MLLWVDKYRQKAQKEIRKAASMGRQAVVIHSPLAGKHRANDARMIGGRAIIGVPAMNAQTKMAMPNQTSSSGGVIPRGRTSSFSTQ